MMVQELLRSWADELRSTPYYHEHFLVQQNELARSFLQALLENDHQLLYQMPRILEYAESVSLASTNLLDSFFRLRDVLSAQMKAGSGEAVERLRQARRRLEGWIVKTGAYFTRTQLEMSGALPTAAIGEAFPTADEIRVELDQLFHIVRINHGFGSLFGVRREEIIGQPFLNFFSPSSHNRIRNAYRLLTENLRVSIELDVEARISDNQNRRVLLKITRTNVGQHPPHFSATLREYLRVEETRNIINLITMALENIDEGIAIFEPGAAGKIQFVNHALEKISGFQRHHLFGKSLFTIFMAEAVPEKLEQIQEKSIRSGWQGELTLRKKTGESFPAYVSTHPIRDEYGSLVALVAVIQDISERKVQEQAILNLQQFIVQIINNLQHYIFVTDEQGVIQFWNEALGRDFGIFSKQAVGKKLQDLLPELEGFYDLPQLLAGEHAHGLTRKKFMRFGQTENRYYRVTVSALPSLNTAKTFLWVIQDIHEEEILKEQITWQNARLKFIENLASFLNALLDFDSIIQTLASKLYEIVPYQELTLLLPLDEEKKTFQVYFRVSQGREQFPDKEEVVVADTPIYTGVVQGLHCKRFQRNPHFHQLESYLRHFQVQQPPVEQVLAVPIRSSNDLLAILNLSHSDAHFFSQMDVEFMEQVASHLAIALQNSLHLEYIEKQNQKLNLIGDIYRTIQKNPPTQQFLDQALESALKVFDASHLLLYSETNPGKYVLRGTASRQTPRPGLLPLHLKLPDGAGKHRPASGTSRIGPQGEEFPQRLLQPLGGSIPLAAQATTTQGRTFLLLAILEQPLSVHRKRNLLPIFRTFLEELSRALEHLLLFQKTKKAQEEWQATFDVVPIALAVVNERFQIVQSNKEFQKQFCRNRRCDHSRPDQIPIPLFQSLTHASSSGAQWARQLRLPQEWQDKENGRWYAQMFVPLFQGKIFQGGILTIRDITEERKKDEHIRYLSRFPEVNPNPVISLKKDGTIVYMNPASLRLLVEHHQALGSERALIPSAVLEKIEKNALLPGKPFECLLEVENRVFQMVAYLPEPESNVYLYGVEITDRLKLQKQLIQTERVRAMGEIAAGVAHDFNNLLTTILGRTQLLLCEVEDAHLEEELRIIEKAARDGSQIVKRMQEITRQRRESSFRPLYLTELIRDSLLFATQKSKLATQVKGQSIKLKVDLDDSLVVFGNPIELKEVFTNLFFNAYDAMPRGGTLSIKTVRLPGEMVQIAIQDTGIGIPPEVIDRIFEPFFTTKGERGTGMGLSLVYNIVQAHHGKIRVQSKPGQGTTFFVELPVSQHRPEATMRKGSPQIAERENQDLRILIVDDEVELLDTLAEILELRFKHVYRASSGKEALQLCAQHDFDVLLTDLGMPGMSGWELAREVKTRYPNIATILVTGWGMQAEEEIAQHPYVDRIISKPYELSELIGLLRSLPVPGKTVANGG